jgi:quercetin dioxygenase-like cupin family protein
MKAAFSIVVVALLLPSLVIGPAASGVRQQPNRPGGVVIMKPTEIRWTDYPNRPGVMVAMIEGDLAKPGPFLMRVKFPAGYKLAPHTHPAVEHTTVLSGALRLGYGTKDDGPTELLPVGTVIVTPASTPHFFSATAETIVQTHGIGPWGSTPVK